jgi:hypothetical protein
MQLLRVYCIEDSKSTTVPVPSGKSSPRGQSTAQKSVNRGPEELYVVWLAPGQGLWAIPVDPEVTGADNVVGGRAKEVEDESTVIDVNIVEPVWVETMVEDDTEGDVDVLVVARFGDPVLRIVRLGPMIRFHRHYRV